MIMIWAQFLFFAFAIVMMITISYGTRKPFRRCDSGMKDIGKIGHYLQSYDCPNTSEETMKAMGTHYKTL